LDFKTGLHFYAGPVCFTTGLVKIILLHAGNEAPRHKSRTAKSLPKEKKRKRKPLHQRPAGSGQK